MNWIVWKYHLAAIGVITVIVLVLFYALREEPVVTPSGEPVFAGSHYIQVATATYGLNCNASIKYYKRQAQSMGMDESEIVEIESNNVLKVVSSICNGKPECSLTADSQSLGIDPLPSCSKNLTVNFRCFAFDKARVRVIRPGDTAVLACKQPA